MKNGNLVGGIIAAIVVIVITAGALSFANKVNDAITGGSVSDKIISGDYDSMLRQKCIDKLNSYGLGDAITQGSINLCVDTAKAIAYHELNK